MAKLTRVFQKVFGSTATAGEIGKFGSFAAGSPTPSTDPVVIQSLSNFLDGWFAAVVGDNSPAMEDMNSLFFLLYRQLAYLFQGGVPEWDAETTYYIGSVVQSNGLLYVSKTDDNINQAVSDTGDWESYGGQLSQKSGDYTVDIADKANVFEMDATAGDKVFTLPTVANAKTRKWTFVKTDSSANVVNITDGTSSFQLNAQYDSITVYSNGTVYYAL